MSAFRVALLLMTMAFAAVAQQPSSSSSPPPEVPPPPPNPAPAQSSGPSATETALPAPPQRPADSALVRASKAGGPRKKSTRKVITNADVKKSGGKLATTGVKSGPPLAGGEATRPVTNTIRSQDELLAAIYKAEAKAAASTKRVDDLEQMMNRVEQSYYEENDLNLRDTVIEKRFEDTRRQLEDARRQLAAAREELDRLNAQRH